MCRRGHFALSVPSGSGVPLLGVMVHQLCLLPWRTGGSPILSVTVWGCPGLALVLPAWLLGSVFGSPGTSGVWQVPFGVGEAVLGSQRVTTNPGLGQLP